MNDFCFHTLEKTEKPCLFLNFPSCLCDSYAEPSNRHRNHRRKATTVAPRHANQPRKVVNTRAKASLFQIFCSHLMLKCFKHTHTQSYKAFWLILQEIPHWGIWCFSLIKEFRIVSQSCAKWHILLSLKNAKWLYTELKTWYLIHCRLKKFNFQAAQLHYYYWAPTFCKALWVVQLWTRHWYCNLLNRMSLSSRSGPNLEPGVQYLFIIQWI